MLEYKDDKVLKETKTIRMRTNKGHLFAVAFTLNTEDPKACRGVRERKGKASGSL